MSGFRAGGFWAVLGPGAQRACEPRPPPLSAGFQVWAPTYGGAESMNAVPSIQKDKVPLNDSAHG